MEEFAEMDVKKKSVPISKYRSGYYLVGFLVVVASSRFLFNQLQCLIDGRNATSEPVPGPYLSPDKCGSKLEISEKPVDNFVPLVEEIHFGEENCLCNVKF
ncbi:unnamed protein product [Allacma fusca]|uniref:Uncharacterized protein n=1 Tax=Allacma fusca TaxID=39272 RepID=A0A8J2PLI3_9HEXA|nr:unnamed protein product [Allacma fusca]